MFGDFNLNIAYPMISGRNLLQGYILYRDFRREHDRRSISRRKSCAKDPPLENDQRPSAQKASAGSLQRKSEGRGARDKVYIKPTREQPER